MKKINMLIGAILLTIVLVTAQLLIQTPKTATLSREAEQWYKDKGIILSYEDFEQEEEFWRCFENTADIDFSFDVCSDRLKTYYLNCVLYDETGETCLEKGKEKTYYTEEEKEKTLDDWKDEILEEIPQIYLEREARQEKELKREGNITIVKK